MAFPLKLIHNDVFRYRGEDRIPLWEDGRRSRNPGLKPSDRVLQVLTIMYKPLNSAVIRSIDQTGYHSGNVHDLYYAFDFKLSWSKQFVSQSRGMSRQQNRIQ
jgi:hypothetical protein